MVTYEKIEEMVQEILEKEILVRPRSTFSLDDGLADDLRIGGDDLSFILTPLLEERVGVRAPVHEWSNVRTGRDAALLMHRYLVEKIEARDAIVTALLEDAAMHEAGTYRAIGRDYDKLESKLPRGPDPDLRAIGIAMTFWDGWIDARNHQWHYYAPITEADWPSLARSIATDLSKRWKISDPMVLANFNLLSRPTLRQRGTNLLRRITSRLGWNPSDLSATRSGMKNPVVVRSGAWLYAGQVPTDVRIIRSDITYGSGDYEDPPESREDREVPCFIVEWGSPGEPGTSRATSGACATLEEAIQHAEELAPGIEWKPVC